LIKEGLEDFEGAILDYNKVIMLNPDDGLAYYNRATCKAGINDYGAGVSDMDDAIRVDPKNAMYYKQRGNFYYQMQNKEKACFDWRRAVEFGDAKARFQIEEYCNKK
jgi:tetratricopeptide (TPR) repeat protein